MSKREPNKPVGQSPCPIKGCELEIPVFKYREVGNDPTRRRFAGRLYGVCPKDGRIENQEFFLEHIKWTEKSAAPAATPQDEKPTPKKASPPPPKPRSTSQPKAPPPETHAPETDKTAGKTTSGWLPEFWK